MKCGLRVAARWLLVFGLAVVWVSVPGMASPSAAQEPQQHAGHEPQSGQQPKEPIPQITDEDRKAAFPPVKGHSVHDRGIHHLVLFDQLEWQSAEGGTGGVWDTQGWVGGDINRLWFRTEGGGEDGRLDEAHFHALYGRAVARWWDVVVGVRQDLRPGPAQTWAAVGIQGLAPYWFEVQVTAYIGPSGRTHARVETEYELLLTNRLVLQPLVEVEAYGESDRERGIGAGLSTIETGVRVRYEVRREFAPYVGVVWERKLFGTADRAREAGEGVGGARLALGARLWF